MKEAVILSYIKEQMTSDGQENNISVNDDLLGSGILDSMGMMRLILFIESEFGMKVPPEDMVIENFMTITHINKYLTKQG